MFFIHSNQKNTIMKPEMILKSDLLDIIFENKNKQYGAYILRKEYFKRLKYSLVTTFVFAATIGYLFFSSKTVAIKKGIADLIKDYHFTTVEIETVKKKEVVVQKKQIQAAQSVKEIPYNGYQIVKDDVVKNIVPTIKDIENAVIGNKYMDGKETTIQEVQLTNTTKVANSINTIVAEDLTKPLEYAEVMPQFPGGMEAFKKFMLKNLRHPNDIEAGINILVRAKFVIDKEGNIINIEIIESGGKELDKEVERVVTKMPKWLPGKQNGSAVAVFFKLPVTFLGSVE